MVCIKRISKNKIQSANQYAYLENEIAALRLIRHKNSLKFYEVLEDHDHIYLATEYLNGRTLSQQIKRNKKMSILEILKIIRSILKVIIKFN